MTTATISQSGSLRAAVATDLLEVESAGGVSAHVAASGIGGLMPANTLTPAQLQNMAAAGLLGATAAGATAQLTVAQATALLNAFTSALQGMVPASGGGTANFLRADGTWAVPAGTAGMVKIAQVVSAASQSTIAFSSIPQTYTDLWLVLSGRDIASSTLLPTRVKFNGDGTSGNYSNTVFSGGNGSADNGSDAATTAGMTIMLLPGVSGNAQAVGVDNLYIPNYKGTTFQKVVFANAGLVYSSQYVVQRSAVWKSTAAVTDLLLTTAGTNYADGTVATLYGMG